MSAAEPSSLQPWSSPSFRWFEASRLCGVLAMQMSTVAVGWQVYDASGKPLYLGLVGLMQFLPSVALVLVSGHVADRFDRRWVVGLSLAGLALAATLLAIQSELGPSVPVIFTAAVLLGIGRAFSGPASQALLVHLVDAPAFPRAVAWHTFMFQVGLAAGPALGGWIYALGGATAVFATSASLFSLGALLVGRLRVSPGGGQARGVSLNTVLEGVRYVWEKRILFAAMSLDLFAVLLGGAVALMPIFARDILAVGPLGLGALRSAPAVGAVLGALFLARSPLRRHVGRTMLACVAGFGVATIVFGISETLWISLIALVVVGATDVVSVTIRQMLVQLSTPDRMRGRVSAVSSVFIGASNELGEFESGVTAALWGPARAVIYGGLGTLGVVLLWSRLFPELRNADEIEAQRA